ncbi:MAG: septum formation inhibitor Maf [Gemmatimonadetes bacterium]|nr:septum formation inhibitor Maf [Gemmatimonadota bacterium]
MILASASPRRRQLLEMLGIPHRVDPSDLPEVPDSGELPERFAVRLAREKALQVAARHPGAPVLGADTVVVLGQQLMGKPASPADAARILEQLSGRDHRVVTAVALALDREVRDRCDVTRVWFRPLTTEMIEAYIATGEPLDKAGAYGVQGYGAVLVERIEGDFFSVMGLPVRLVIELLESAGLPYRFTR